MRTMIESGIESQEQTDSEITLNAKTLLGIFFGLVLVCGVFFGFGYSIGRRGGTDTPKETASANVPAASTSDDSPAPAAASTHAPKPSAMQSLQAADSNASSSANSTTVTEPVDADSASSGKHTAQSAQAVTPTARTAALAPKPTPASVPASAPAQPLAKPTLKPASLPVAPANTTAPLAAGAASVMVQIAAVSHQEDANVLVSALRQHGYSVSVRNEPQDKLLHVQLGPFATRDEAKAMRAKLLADGYNAILKQ